MVFIVLGPSGCGKGTQAGLLAKEFSLPHISAGEVLREESRNKTPEGVEAEGYWRKGLWAPTKIVWRLLKPRLDRIGRGGFVLEGWPRPPEQAQLLDDYLREKDLKVDRVFYLRTSDETAEARIKKRVKNTLAAGEKPRSDETPKVIKERLREYHRTIRPILEYYKNRGVLEIVGNEKSVEEVFADICSRLR